MAWVYILECSDGSYYVGSTRNLDGRLQQHAMGKGAKYTSRRLPITLLWAQPTESIAEAYAWEKKIQGWSRAKREALMRDDWGEIRRRSKRRGGRDRPTLAEPCADHPTLAEE